MDIFMGLFNNGGPKFKGLRLLAVAAGLSAYGSVMAVGPGEIVFHDEARDTVRINEILTEVISERPVSTGAFVSAIGMRFVGTPYVAHTLEGPDERLRVNLDELDCTTFVETVAAMALTATEGRSSWRDFVNMLENLRYRSGRLNDYGSRLHYISDWVVENSYRGNLKDMTNIVDGSRLVTKSIDYMTTNRDKYPALKDSLNYERMKSVEQGYRNHRFAYVPTSVLKRKETQMLIHDGDIVGLTTNLRNLDVTHMGIVILKEGVPYLLHASSSEGKVTVSDVPFAEFMRRNRQFNGVRILRLRDL